MYSLLLMTALAGTPDATAFGWGGGGCYGGCGGFASCYGCCGGFASCNGCCGGYASCYGCSGCSGYSRGGFLGCGILARLCGRMSSCHGCYGSCYGSGYGSCYGSGYGSGCWGSCYGSGLNSGCWGSCYGSGLGGGCWGSCYGSGGGCFGSGMGCIGGAYPMVDGVAVPTPAIPPTTAPAPTVPKTSSNSMGEAAPAQLTVELPQGAKLYVDGTPTTLKGTTRQFHTPELPNGQAFFYELKAEVTIDGKTEVEQKRVVVRAGDTITATFPKLLARSQGGAATVAVSK